MNLIQAHKEIWFQFTALRIWSGLSASIPWKEAKYGLKSLSWIFYFGRSGSVSVLRNEGTFRLRITLYQRPPKRGSDSLYLRLTEKWSGSSKVGFVSSRLLASRKFSCWRMKYRNDPFFTKRSIRNKNDVHKWLILLVGDLMGWTPDRKRKSMGNLCLNSIENHRAFDDQWSPIGFVIFVSF